MTCARGLVVGFEATALILQLLNVSLDSRSVRKCGRYVAEFPSYSDLLPRQRASRSSPYYDIKFWRLRVLSRRFLSRKSAKQQMPS
jgi:hypothetical protein